MLSNKRKIDGGAVATAEGVKPARRSLSRNSDTEFFINIIEKNAHIRETISISDKLAT